MILKSYFDGGNEADSQPRPRHAAKSTWHKEAIVRKNWWRFPAGMRKDVVGQMQSLSSRNRIKQSRNADVHEMPDRNRSRAAACAGCSRSNCKVKMRSAHSYNNLERNCPTESSETGLETERCEFRSVPRWFQWKLLIAEASCAGSLVFSRQRLRT